MGSTPKGMRSISPNIKLSSGTGSMSDSAVLSLHKYMTRYVVCQNREGGGKEPGYKAVILSWLK